MSKKVEVKLISKGIQSLLKGNDIADMIGDMGKEMLKEAKNMHNADNYELTVQKGKYRTIAAIKPKDAHAKASNRKYNTLLKVVSKKR